MLTLKLFDPDARNITASVLTLSEVILVASEPAKSLVSSEAEELLTEGERDRFTLRDEIRFSSSLHPNLAS